MPKAKQDHAIIQIRIPSDVAHTARINAVTRGVTYEEYYAAAIAAFNQAQAHTSKHGKQPTDV